MSMLSPGGIDTPFNNGKWNTDSQKKDQLPNERAKKRKRVIDTDPASQAVLGNLANLLSNVSAENNIMSASTHTLGEK